MRYSHEVSLPVAAEAIDLPDWLFSLSEADYAGCQRGHRAIGVVGGATRGGMVNVESIGGSLLIQHYATHTAQPHHVTMVSDASRVYLMHLLPVAVGVVWDMRITPDGAGSRFRCSIEVRMPIAVRLLGLCSASPFFVHRHLVEETRGFAGSIARKARPDAAAPAIRDVAT